MSGMIGSRLAGACLAVSVALASSGCSSDPCDGQSGTCLSVEIQGSVMPIDALTIEIAGAVKARRALSLPSNHEDLPASVRVLIPAATGMVEADVVALHGMMTVATGRAQAALATGSAARMTVAMQAQAGARCDDGFHDGDETDVDCGGSCMPCDAQKSCDVARDCRSGVCAADGCAAPACGDGVQNGDETDVDCGGSCVSSANHSCGDGFLCKVAKDCAGGLCIDGHCASCANKMLDGDETDVDCGGSCAKMGMGLCVAGRHCKAGSDCASGACSGGVCAAATCSDGDKNGDETDVDCGGSCAPCGAGKGCGANGDCASGNCSGGTCAN